MDSDSFWLLINFITFNGVFALKVMMLFLLLFCSALISGAEVAFFGLTPTDVKQINKKRTTKADIVLRLSEKPKKLLATILIANNAINIGIVLLFNIIGDTLFNSIDYVWFGFVSVQFLLEVVVAHIFDSYVWRNTPLRYMLVEIELVLPFSWLTHLRFLILFYLHSVYLCVQELFFYTINWVKKNRT